MGWYKIFSNENNQVDCQTTATTYRKSYIKKNELKTSWDMNSTYTAVMSKEDDWWIGWIEEIPGVNCQEPTRSELIETLKITLREALEFNRQDAIRAAGNRYVEELIVL